MSLLDPSLPSPLDPHGYGPVLEFKGCRLNTLEDMDIYMILLFPRKIP